MYNLYRGLIELGHEVDVLAMNTYKQFCDITTVPEEFKKQSNYTLVEVDLHLKVMPALYHLLINKSYNISRFDTPAFRRVLSQKLDATRYDMVILESLFSTCYIDLIREKMKGSLVYRSHNVEFNIWNNLALHERNPLKRLYLQLLANQLKKYELTTLQQVDFIASISEPDVLCHREHGITTPMEYVPFGISFQDEAFKVYRAPQREETAFFHVGSMDWMPHQEAVRWVLTEVWPKFHPQHPEVKLYLAGSNMPDWISQGDFPGVVVTQGYVNGQEFMKDKTIMLVPSFSGSGVRIKMAEGMAKGKVILTTTNGAMGIPCTHNENALISDDPNEWAQMMSRCMTDFEWVKLISLNARRFAENEFDCVGAAGQLVSW